ncbi:MAG: amidohydrolase family protein, partial [Candidatus Heimdallarchaeota archaeon]
QSRGKKKEERDKILIHNCHIHTFTRDDVPENFLGQGLARLMTRFNMLRVARILNALNIFRDDNQFDRYANFIRIMRCNTQEDIFKYVSHYYPSDTKFIVLAMDMAFMSAGKVQDYSKQLQGLKELKEKYKGKIYPFVAVDPRRADSSDDLLALVEGWFDEYKFYGIKIYPPLGYFPFDDKLEGVYKFALKKELPILAHASKSGPVFTRMKRNKLIDTIKTGLKDYLPEEKLRFKGKRQREICNYFTHPENWKIAFEKFGKFKTCLAHFGGSGEWERYLNPSTKGMCGEKIKSCKKKKIEGRYWVDIIYDLMKENDNLYTDISMTLHNPEFFPILRVLLENPEVNKQILFGTDFYMDESKISERTFGFNVRGYLGHDTFKLIAETNPRKFLSSKFYKLKVK